MTAAISSATVQAVQAPSPNTAKPVKTATAAAPAENSKSTVTLSKAAIALAAAYKESVETPTQTAQEARANDHQAQRLLAKEAAAKR